MWSVLETNMMLEGRQLVLVPTARTKYTFSILASPLNFQQNLPLPFHRKKVMTKYNVTVVVVVKIINLHVSLLNHILQFAYVNLCVRLLGLQF